MIEEEKQIIPSSVIAIFVAGGLLIVTQQQILFNKSPRLREINIQQIRSGSAALDLQFSRPIQIASVRKASRIHPYVPHQWLGIGKRIRLLLDSHLSIKYPLKLELNGEDNRGTRLKKSQWWWDPRPSLIVVVKSSEGEQIQLQLNNGNWIPVSPVWKKIVQVEPLGNGHGIAFVSLDNEWRQQVWLRHVSPTSISSTSSQLTSPKLGHLKLLTSEPKIYAFLSSNQHGELLVQVGGEVSGSNQIWVQEKEGVRTSIKLKPFGPIKLIPDGSGLVMPSLNGLTLAPLLQSKARSSPQLLPGDRKLKAFCSGSGRALVTNILQDYRESVELIIPGLPPKQILLTNKSIVIGASCDNQGERILIILRNYKSRLTDQILLLDSDGQILKRRMLAPWVLVHDTKVEYDPVEDQFLLVLLNERTNLMRPALIKSMDLAITIIEKQALNAHWLPAGANVNIP